MKRNYDYEKNFTKEKTNGKMKTNYNMYEMSNLNDEQIRNVKSAYKAKESGIILAASLTE